MIPHSIYIALAWMVFPVFYLLIMLLGIDPNSINTYWSCLIFVLVSYLFMPIEYYSNTKKGYQVLRFTSLLVSFSYFIIEMLIAIGFLTYWDQKSKLAIVVQLTLLAIFLIIFSLTKAANQSTINNINNKSKKY